MKELKPCPEKAKGCRKVFEFKNRRSVCCENPACKHQRKKRFQREWEEAHKEERRSYQLKYRLL